MGFLIHKRTAANGRVRYERLKPLKLGGYDGLIARHVRALTAAETTSWKLDAAGLLRLAGHGEDGNAVLFDVSGRDTTNVCLYELSCIRGSCRDTSTQLALDLSVLIDQEVGVDAAGFAEDFEVASTGKAKSLGEILSLTGGPGGGDWKWGSSPLQIGATVVPAHHGGPPCPGCSCGRAASQA